MTTAQLLKLITTNRELIQRNNVHAVEHFQMLKSDFGHIENDEVLLNIELNNSLVEVHFYSNHAKAIANSLLAIDRFKNSPHQNLVARHYWLIGHCYANRSEYQKAEDYLLMAWHAVVPEEPVSTSIKTDTLIALAMNEEFRRSGQEKSINYLKQALALLSDDNFAIRRAACLMGLGNVYINSGKIDDALEHYNTAAQIYERFFDLANMASVYSNIGTCYIELKDFVKAEIFMEKSLELRLKLGSPDHLSISYYNLAIIHKETNRLESARELLLKSKEILVKSGNAHYLKQTEELLEIVAALHKAQVPVTDTHE